MLTQHLFVKSEVALAHDLVEPLLYLLLLALSKRKLLFLIVLRLVLVLGHISHHPAYLHRLHGHVLILNNYFHAFLLLPHFFIRRRHAFTSALLRDLQLHVQGILKVQRSRHRELVLLFKGIRHLAGRVDDGFLLRVAEALFGLITAISISGQ